jgi:ATP phosphoribosyltransferase regulatory subunit
MFKFQDRDGKIVALRAEMTAPVARIVTTKLTSVLRPLRLFYLCNVFRYDLTHFEQLREFRQAGIELIGQNTPDSDGEGIALLHSCLKTLGLKDVRVDLSHAGLLKDLLHATGLNIDDRSLLQKLLSTRNIDQMKRFMNEFGVSSPIFDLFVQLSTCKNINDLSLIKSTVASIESVQGYLLDLNEVLSYYNIESSVFFDFSLTRNIDYYTGIIFEASIPHMGVPLGGGGRYDTLIERFGGTKDAATGFAIGAEKCLLALSIQKFRFPINSTSKILISARSRKIAMDVVTLFRNAKIPCLFTLDTKQENPTNYMNRGIDSVIFVEASIERPVAVYDVKADSVKHLNIDTFIQSLEGP